MSRTLKMALVKSTKNTHVYSEVQEGSLPPIIPSLYIQQWAFTVPAPKELTLTLEYPEA